MTLEDVYGISQVAAAFAVIGSLFFVGMQSRQTDKTQRAAMHQARAQRNMDLLLPFVRCGGSGATGSFPSIETALMD